MSKNSMNITETLADYVVGLNYDRIPPQVVERAKHLFLDFLGVALGGRQAESTGPMLEAVRELSAGARGDASVAGEVEGFPVHMAALLNGTLAHSMDFDDTHRGGPLHPGTPIFASLLALAETAHASGPDFLTAAIAGYDVTCKLGNAHGEGVHKRGFHPTATTGVFGGVAAGARLLRLDKPTLVNALGLAGSMSAGSMQFLENGAWNKRVHVGTAASNAIVGLTLARSGVVGSSQPLEGRFGYLNAYSCEPWDGQKAIQGLGKDFEVMQTAIKPYPCCRYNHGVIDAVTALAREHKIKAQDVAEVQVRLNPLGIALVAEPEAPKRNPQTVVDGQFSVYFAVAASLQDGAYSWESYNRLHDPAVRSLMGRVRAVASPQVAGMGTQVRIATRNGGVLSRDVALAKGEPETPLTWDELLLKFRSLARHVLSEKQTESLIQQVATLDQAADVASVARLLRPM